MNVKMCAMRFKSLSVAMILVLTGCSMSATEKADAAIQTEYEKLKPLLVERDNYKSAAETWLARAISHSREVSKQEAEREFSKIAISGKAGTVEALREVKRQIDSGFKPTPTIQDQWPNALERVRELKISQDESELAIRERLPVFPPLLEAYEKAYKEEYDRTTNVPKRSYGLKDVIREIESEIGFQKYLASQKSEKSAK